MNRTYLRQLLLSNSHKFLITAEGYASAVMEAFSVISDNPQSTFFFNPKPPTYKEISGSALAFLKKEHAELQDVTLTDQFTSDELPDGSIAYHRIWGIITSDSYWYFSSKQFERDLLAAERNPAITCHFIHANSPGGEAWYLDRLSETMRSLHKPVLTLVEQYNCSACYYITCHSDIIAALTANETIGSIGTMSEFIDLSGWYEKMGIKDIVIKATKSDLKNKKYDDVLKGKPEQYIHDRLDPLTEQFLSEVKNSRSQLNTLADDDPVFRGETFDTSFSIEKGLIDQSMTFIEAVAKAIELGKGYESQENLKRNALKYV